MPRGADFRRCDYDCMGLSVCLPTYLPPSYLLFYLSIYLPDSMLAATQLAAYVRVWAHPYFPLQFHAPYCTHGTDC